MEQEHKSQKQRMIDKVNAAKERSRQNYELQPVKRHWIEYVLIFGFICWMTVLIVVGMYIEHKRIDVLNRSINAKIIFHSKRNN